MRHPTVIALALIAGVLGSACTGEIVLADHADAGPSSTTATPAGSSRGAPAGCCAGQPLAADAATPSAGPLPQPATVIGGVEAGGAPGAPSAELDAGAFGAPYPCHATDAGLACSCPSIGNDLADVTGPDPSAVTPYTTLQGFDALAVGRWQRTQGGRQMDCEQVGVEFTADHYVVPLVVGPDGNVDPVVTAGRGPFQLSFALASADLVFDDPGFGLTTTAPR
ncbi:MAG: hypothetical protein ACRENE_23595, partial [Polyangiaceae bacterium]